MGTEEPIFKEALQRLPAGRNRRYSPLSADKPPAIDSSITNVAGYETLVGVATTAGEVLSRDLEGIRGIERLIDELPDSISGLAHEIGMFYGDVLTHTIVGSYWIVFDEARPEVQVGEGTTVDVVGVAERRLKFGAPSLLENLKHVKKMVAEGS